MPQRETMLKGSLLLQSSWGDGLSPCASQPSSPPCPVLLPFFLSTLLIPRVPLIRFPHVNLHLGRRGWGITKYDKVNADVEYHISTSQSPPALHSLRGVRMRNQPRLPAFGYHIGPFPSSTLVLEQLCPFAPLSDNLQTPSPIPTSWASRSFLSSCFQMTFYELLAQL